ncbi:type VII secretion system-associated protein [Streptomyces sp. STR69]|uniref:type VII secretion system-associated protein n=1 Tax=Streptomyces sp. STR69 TaxID=1796942 RepID=UPI0021C6E3BF|nr:type VII secretion system-associated protein [Streptomyces sp. STR69]
MADVTRMDSAWLQNFLTNNIEPFSKAIDTIENVDDPSPSLGTVIGGKVTDTSRPQNKPLAIGKMAVDDSVQGLSLNKAVASAAQSIITIYEDQADLFSNIHDDIKTTIDTLLTTQNTNLTQIEGKDFLDVFSNVDGDLSGSSGTSGSGSGS